MSASIMALVVSIALGFAMTSAHASACSDEIAQLEKAMSEKKCRCRADSAAIDRRAARASANAGIGAARRGGINNWRR